MEELFCAVCRARNVWPNIVAQLHIREGKEEKSGHSTGFLCIYMATAASSARHLDGTGIFFRDNPPIFSSTSLRFLNSWKTDIRHFTIRFLESFFQLS